MENLRELDDGTIERLEDKEFIRWMIEKLNNEQLDMLLFSTSNAKNYKSQAKQHKQILQNKILLKNIRTKLRTMRLLPPFDFIITNKEELKSKESVKKEVLLEIAEENNADSRQTALLLFLQNYYEEALELYDNRKEEDKGQKEKPKESKEQPISENKAETLSPKQEKKLQQKMDTLMKEKEELINQVQQLKKELKEKNTEHQKELNLLSQEVAAEKENAMKFEEEILRLTKQLENERITHKELKQKAKEEPKPVTIPMDKKKLAIIGNPMNKKILSDNRFDIDLFELEDIERLCQNHERYDHMLFLSYVIDEVLYEEQIPREIRKEIKRIANFKELRDVMGEL